MQVCNEHVTEPHPHELRISCRGYIGAPFAGSTLSILLSPGNVGPTVCAWDGDSRSRSLLLGLAHIDAVSTRHDGLGRHVAEEAVVYHADCLLELGCSLA